LPGRRSRRRRAAPRPQQGEHLDRHAVAEGFGEQRAPADDGEPARDGRQQRGLVREQLPRQHDLGHRARAHEGTIDVGDHHLRDASGQQPVGALGQREGPR